MSAFIFDFTLCATYTAMALFAWHHYYWGHGVALINVRGTVIFSGRSVHGGLG